MDEGDGSRAGRRGALSRGILFSPIVENGTEGPGNERRMLIAFRVFFRQGRSLGGGTSVANLSCSSSAFDFHLARFHG
jgi:hypothetical protein